MHDEILQLIRNRLLNHHNDHERLILFGMLDGMSYEASLDNTPIPTTPTPSQVATLPSPLFLETVQCVKFLIASRRYSTLERIATAGDSKALITLLERDTNTLRNFKPPKTEPTQSINLNLLIADAHKLADSMMSITHE